MVARRERLRRHRANNYPPPSSNAVAPMGEQIVVRDQTGRTPISSVLANIQNVESTTPSILQGDVTAPINDQSADPTTLHITQSVEPPVIPTAQAENFEPTAAPVTPTQSIESWRVNRLPCPQCAARHPPPCDPDFFRLGVLRYDNRHRFPALARYCLPYAESQRSEFDVRIITAFLALENACTASTENQAHETLLQLERALTNEEESRLEEEQDQTRRPRQRQRDLCSRCDGFHNTSECWTPLCNICNTHHHRSRRCPLVVPSAAAIAIAATNSAQLAQPGHVQNYLPMLAQMTDLVTDRGLENLQRLLFAGPTGSLGAPPQTFEQDAPTTTQRGSRSASSIRTRGAGRRSIRPRNNPYPLPIHRRGGTSTGPSNRGGASDNVPRGQSNPRGSC